MRSAELGGAAKERKERKEMRSVNAGFEVTEEISFGGTKTVETVERWIADGCNPINRCVNESGDPRSTRKITPL